MEDQISVSGQGETERCQNSAYPTFGTSGPLKNVSYVWLRVNEVRRRTKNEATKTHIQEGFFAFR